MLGESSPKRLKMDTGSSSGDGANVSNKMLGESSPKRLKMDTSSSSGDGANVSNKELEILRYAVTFSEIRDADTFVDKSLLIHRIFHHTSTAADGSSTKVHDAKPNIMITAPRRFGKSINMDMIKCFLEIQSDGNKGEDIPINERSNWKLFEGLKIMGPKYTGLVKQHFGQYPVLKVTFLCGDVISKYDDMVDFCKGVVHEVFKRYQYLTTSPRLSEGDKGLCKKWCCNDTYHNLNRKHTQEGLKVLCEYLCLHFEKPQVFILIDEYDSPITEAVFNSKMNPDELSLIMKFYTGMLGSLLKDNARVLGAVVTGISCIAGVGLSSELGCLKSHQFLNNSFFVEYYGFTEAEVGELFSKFGVSVEERKSIDKTYNGYKNKNGEHTIYNPYSVISYLDNRQAGPISHWVTSGSVLKLRDAFKYQAYRKPLNAVLWNCVSIDVQSKLEKDDLVRLAAISSGIKKIPDVDIFLSFLLEQGYLSYVGDKKNNLKLPNMEIKQEFHRKLKVTYTVHYGLDDQKREDCADSFVELFSSLKKNDEEFKIALQDVKTKLQHLVSDELLSKIGKVNHATLQQILSNPLLDTGYMYGSEICTPSNKTPDFFLSNNECAVIIELKYAQGVNDARNTSYIGLKQIIDSKYYELFTNTTYLPSGVKEYILMGLSFADNKSFSISCLRGKNGKNIPTVEDIKTKAIHLD